MNQLTVLRKLGENLNYKEIKAENSHLKEKLQMEFDALDNVLTFLLLIGGVFMYAFQIAYPTDFEEIKLVTPAFTVFSAALKMILKNIKNKKEEQINQKERERLNENYTFWRSMVIKFFPLPFANFNTIFSI